MILMWANPLLWSLEGLGPENLHYFGTLQAVEKRKRGRPRKDYKSAENIKLGTRRDKYFKTLCFII
jgi:hypothetical protein